MRSFFTEDVQIEDITIPDGRRATDPEKVSSLAESIRINGLLQPAGLNDDYRLIWGRHRLEACILLGWKTIPCRILDLTGQQAELAEIDENLERSELTKVQYLQALARRKEIYEALHPETKHGGNRKGEKSSCQNGDLKTFVQDTAKKTGKSERTIHRDVAVGEKLDTQAAADISECPEVANSKKQLTELAKLPPAEQQSAAKKIKSGEAKSVAEAAAPKPEKSETVEDRMKAANAVLESSARSIKTIRDELEKIDNPHLSDAMHGRLATILAHLKSAEGTIRSAKGAGECTYCGGKGCKHCLKTGWLTKTALESAPENKAA